MPAPTPTWDSDATGLGWGPGTSSYLFESPQMNLMAKNWDFRQRAAYQDARFPHFSAIPGTERGWGPSMPGTAVSVP